MAEQFVYNADAEKHFYEKLNDFHDEYVYHLVMNGFADKGVDLESIKMTKNPQASQKYCERVVGGLVNVKPEIILKLIEEGNTRLECVFTTLNDNKVVNNELFMVQNVMDWPKLGGFSCQIWYLGETSVNKVKEYWNN